MSEGAPTLVAEERVPGEVPLWRHPEWEKRFPWLVQGVTSGGEGETPFDLGLFGTQPVGAVVERWRRLREALGVSAVAHSRQVHGPRILAHLAHPGEGLHLSEGYDGHRTATPDLLLTASVADCVPVSIVDPERRALAVVHAGWRGVVAGIVESAIDALPAEHGSNLGALWLHCGPAICGECYEVGPEVHAAVRPDRQPPPAPTPIDLRAAIAERVMERGMAAERVSLSTHCTRCGEGGFFSHRGGSAARQMAFLAIRAGG